MESQAKELIVNGSIALLVVLAGIFGYFIFVSKGDNVVKQAFVQGETSATDKILNTGNEVATTIRDVEKLRNAVASTTVIFASEAFVNLKDFSVSVPEEAVGRPNPFVPSAWKLKQIADQERLRKQGARLPSGESL